MRTLVAVLALTLSVLTVAGQAQFRARQLPPQMATPESFDGGFNFCRGMYKDSPFGVGGRWSTDYPSADVNLSIRLSELTRIRVSRAADGGPNHLVVRPTDDELFSCPFVLMAEVGSAYFDEEDATRLRAYLLKGGFLWVDDFWGSQAWDNWEFEIRKVFPAAEFPIVDLPADHPVFGTHIELPGIPQVPSINYWLRSGGDTSERGADSAQPHARAILHADGRLMVFMTHNTDISDGWEREGEDPTYFYQFSVDAYAVAINVLLHVLTH